jgi:hypothetical protein
MSNTVCRVYLCNKVVAVMPIDGRKAMIGEVYHDRALALQVYMFVCDLLKEEGRLDKESSIIN